MLETMQNKGGRPRKFDYDSALGAALNLFMRYGYDGVSLNELTHAMGIAAPSLYATYGNKEALYQKALDMYENQRAAIFSFDESVSTFEALANILDRAIENATLTDQPCGCIISAGLLYSSRSNEALVDLHRQRRHAILERFRNIFEQARERGELPRQTDCGALARLYSSILQGMAIQARDGARAEELSAVAKLALKLWPGPKAQQSQ